MIYLILFKKDSMAKVPYTEWSTSCLYNNRGILNFHNMRCILSLNNIYRKGKCTDETIVIGINGPKQIIVIFVTISGVVVLVALYIFDSCNGSFDFFAAVQNGTTCQRIEVNVTGGRGGISNFVVRSTVIIIIALYFVCAWELLSVWLV